MSKSIRDYQILAVLSVSKWVGAKELNLISWNDREPKYDIPRLVTGSREDGEKGYPCQGDCPR